MSNSSANFLKCTRKILSLLAHTPCHPQWLLKRTIQKRFTCAGAACSGLVLDIGCTNQRIRANLSENTDYIGLDYPITADNLYKTRPTVFGDAQQLPFSDHSFDTVILFEVLEHIPDPMKAIREVHRILKPNGHFILSVPFLYPLHDAPFDFQRFTVFGLEHIAKSHNFCISERSSIGTAIGTCALLSNIALCYSLIKGFKSKNATFLIAALSTPFVIALVVVSNCIGWVSEITSKPDDFMPFGFSMILRKL